MRAILGVPDCPDSSYILVLRGFGNATLEYFRYHVKKYPTWGCLVFPNDRGPIPPPISLTTEVSPIHRIFEEKYFASDTEIIKWVKESFPPFSEDEMGSVPYREEGDLKIDTRSVITAMELAGLFTHKYEFISGCVHTCKDRILRKVLEMPEFWDIDLSTDAHTGNMQVRVTLNVGKVRDLSIPIKECADTISTLGKSLGESSRKITDVLGALGVAPKSEDFPF